MTIIRFGCCIPIVDTMYDKYSIYVIRSVQLFVFITAQYISLHYIIYIYITVGHESDGYVGHEINSSILSYLI